MPRRIKEVKVIAINDGKNPVKYLTEDIAVYCGPDDFMRCALVVPHRERYEIRYVAHDSYESCRPWMPHISEEEFNFMFQGMAEFSPYGFYNPEEYVKHFNILWEGGCLSPW